MYEENRVSVVGRLIWAIVSLLVLAALVWLVLWLLFWRSPDVDEVADTTKKTGTSAIESGNTAVSTPTDSSVSSSTTAPSASSNSSTDTTKKTTTPSTSSTSSTGTTTTAPSSTAPTAGQTSSTSTKVPNGQLANTGPSDAVLPVILTAVGATMFYQIRLRRAKNQ
ncbi:hypothetical protein JNM87_06980 [Candidatus Saccharibacteria bacterium]|nr:hypothetical protein [Candidatus Saccharibacteria bacterium]